MNGDQVRDQQGDALFPRQESRRGRPGESLRGRQSSPSRDQALSRFAPLRARTRNRCGATLFAYKPHGFERAFILYLAALLLLVIANAFPFLTLKVQGQLQSSHLISGAIDLYRKG
jgi:hypothetical protein